MHIIKSSVTKNTNNKLIVNNTSITDKAKSEFFNLNLTLL